MRGSLEILENINIEPGIIRKPILELSIKEATSNEEKHARVLKERVDIVTAQC